MRAVIQSEPGGLDRLSVGEVEPPQPAAGEALVAVSVAGLNPVDWKLTAKGFAGWDWPHVPGVDGCGRVEAVGGGVDADLIGRRVAWHGRLDAHGACAPHTVVPAYALAAVPDAVDDEQAAALPCAGMTAADLIARALPGTGCEHALVHAGAGGVGGFAIQLLAARGVRVFTTCSPSNDDRVRRLGAAEAIDYHSEDVTARVRELTGGQGADLIINTISRDSATEDLDRLAYNGALGFVAGQPHFDRFKAFTLACSFHEAALGAAHFAEDERARRRLATTLEELLARVAAAELDAMVADVVDLESIPGALHRLSERHVAGKLVARVA